MDPAHRPTFGHRLLRGAMGAVGAFVLYLVSSGPVTFFVVLFHTDGLWATHFYYPAYVLLFNSPFAPAGLDYIQWWSDLGKAGRRTL